jgi:hypothetical protein
MCPTRTTSSTPPESWASMPASEVKVGDVVRTSTEDVVVVSRIETSFLGRPNMIAFIEDTPGRWYKRPVTVDAEVEVHSSTAP